MSIRVKDNSVTFKTFKDDDYYAVTGMREEYKTSEPDYPGVVMTGPSRFLGTGDDVLTPDGKRGKITGFARDGDSMTSFARVNGRLYHVSVLKRG